MSTDKLEFHLTATVVGLHEITSNPNAKDRGYVTPTQLRDYLRRKKSEGYSFVQLDGAFETRARQTKNLLITLDDGYLGNYEHASVFEDEGAPAVFYIHPSSIGSPNGAYPKMSWAQVMSLSERSIFEIGSHSWQHRELTKLSTAQLRDDFARTNQAIRQRTGITPRSIAYPSGAWDQEVTAAASQHYQCGFSYGSRSGARNQRFALPRLSMHQSNVNSI
ncbi:MAG: polysaccharide deacetylase family protein [Myxococcota bacterium]